MAQGFLKGEDIANRGLQRIGARRIVTFADATRNAVEANALYDKIRRSELRRSVWNFACRRCVLRTSATGVMYIPALWAIGTTYDIAECAIDANGQIWQSRVGGNIGNVAVEGVNWTAYNGPLLTDAWSASVTYYPGDLVVSGGVPYIAHNAVGNINHVPPNATYWSAFSAAGFTTPSLFQPSPVNYSRDFVSRNVFKLPYGFLRIAPQDQKRADIARLSVSAEMRYRDWEIENGLLLTTDASPFIFRYVADITDVTQMDDLFCEAVAARVGMELCEVLTQSKEKYAAAQGAYDFFIGLAKDINAVEGGSTENEEDPDMKGSRMPAQPAGKQQ